MSSRRSMKSSGRPRADRPRHTRAALARFRQRPTRPPGSGGDRPCAPGAPARGVGDLVLGGHAAPAARSPQVESAACRLARRPPGSVSARRRWHACCASSARSGSCCGPTADAGDDRRRVRHADQAHMASDWRAPRRAQPDAVAGRRGAARSGRQSSTPPRSGTDAGYTTGSSNRRMLPARNFSIDLVAAPVEARREPAERVAAALDVRVVAGEQVQVGVGVADHRADVLERVRRERGLLGQLLATAGG